jgi:putative hydrolase of the HAD superfamily
VTGGPRGEVRVDLRVDAVLLDIDDTLVDTRHAFRTAIGAVVARWLPHLDGTGVARALQLWLADAAGHFRAYTRGEIGFSEQRWRRAQALHAALGGPAVDEELFLDWERAWEQAFHGAWRPCADAEPLLDWLDAHGLPFGTVTNAATAYQQDKLDAVGLSDRVAFIVGTDVFGVGKPDPRPFIRGCELLGIDPSRVAHVGDEVDHDARGARDAGLLGIWLDRHDTGLTPDDVAVARTLADVPALLAAGRRTAP